jgi:hypothetical protein
VAESFNNTGKVLEALTDGVAIVDRSHWGRIRVGGADRVSFLHNQSTNDFKSLKPGQGCDTVPFHIWGWGGLTCWGSRSAGGRGQACLVAARLAGRRPGVQTRPTLSEHAV